MDTLKADNVTDFRDQVAEIVETLSPKKQVPFTSCCYGSAIYGPARCTCWTYEFDLEQAPATNKQAESLRKCCHDCAYRSDSPERSGKTNHSCSADMPGGLPDVPANGLFFCHQGMRKAIAATHVPTGLRVEFSHGDNYHAPNHCGKPILANGDFAPLCAGFASVRDVTDEQASERLNRRGAFNG